ncbi:sialyltransferase [Methanobrevibacter ruminantium]|uniref:sialyltransferase n=1 Tax=Methanobrevibacter ruminantium TaxID=83816 RepID=UPI0026F0A7A8|nr:sialyltransferase [Methanobrevibacter ruminantium]MCI5737513.1 CDP-glycerol glycerophosphotransferase family protein [Methanobrevibacter ruminantium]
MTFTVKEICQKIWNLEEKYELNHKEIQGCYPWQLIRMYLYYEITRKTNVFESAQQSSLSLFDKINSFLPFVKNSILSNPLSGNENVDALIFDHPRKVIFEDEYQDIYSYFLKDTLNQYGKSFETIESPYLNQHFRSNENIKENNVKFNDRILLGSFIHKTRNRGKLHFTESEMQYINSVKEELETAFEIEIDLFRIMEDHILNFQYDYKKYIELLQRKKPKVVFLVVAYENKALLAACKKMNIGIIELQHGTISPYHLGYSYPENTMKFNGELKEIEYFPDKILSFGNYWKNACPFPIDSENIIPMGFPYFEENSKTYMKIAEDKNSKEGNNQKTEKKQILFISQGVIGKYLSELAYETALNMNKNNENNEDNAQNYNFIYKLHPGEYGTWKENYDYLTKAVNEFDNFTVINKSEPPLYELFAESHYQIGAFSTAIYEGLAFNCKTFIIDVPGVEYLDDLIDKDIVKKVNSSEELINYINNENISIQEYDKDYFFKNFDETIFKKILSD